MFEKLVAIEPVSLVEEAEKELFQYAKQVVMYEDIPCDDEEIIRRIGDADGVLLSYTSRIVNMSLNDVLKSNMWGCAAAFIQRRAQM